MAGTGLRPTAPRQHGSVMHGDEREGLGMNEIEVRRQISRLTHWGTVGWTRTVQDEYTAAFAATRPNILEQAVTQAIRERATRPQINQLAEIYAHLQEADDRLRRDRVMTEGVGCPRCLHEYTDGRHARWIATPYSQLVSCLEHRWSWRGTQPAEPDPGELPADVWHQLAIQGTFGHVIQAYARAWNGPATLTEGLTTRLAERPAA